MTTVIVRRPQRRPEPPYPSGEIMLEAPPEVPKPSGRGWSQVMMMLPMLAGSVAMALMFAGQRGGPFAYVTGGLFGLSAVGMLASQFGSHAGGASKQEMLLARQEYLRHLAQQRRRARRAAKQQRETLAYRHPDPQALWTIPDSLRVWERRTGDGDFLTVRIGLGLQELAMPLIPPQSKPLEDLEPMCALALRRFVTAYTNVPDLPLVMAVDGFSRVHLRGHQERCTSLVRAVVGQVAAFHAPDDVLVAICAAPERRPDWEWVKWLPHALHPTKTDAVGELRLVSTTLTGLEAMLEDVLAGRPRFGPNLGEARTGHPHVVVVVDGGDVAGSDHLMTEGGVEGVTLLDLTNPPPRVLDRAALVLDVADDGRLHGITFEGRNELGRADSLTLSEAEAFALRLAPLRLSQASRGETATSTVRDLGLTELLDLSDPEQFDPVQSWVPRPNRDRLRVPIGVASDGTPLELDLKESAQDGMGPHGLLIGATGAGKSELLRTLVLALAVTHSSETLNFVLIDFKGGATFTRLDKLPHTSAVITNLADELPLVDRMTDAINGEIVRRQELLRRAGNYASVRDYERARAAGAPLAPLPSLFIICDEFSELLTAKPDFIEMFVQIGRVGRSLGVHLLLASQRLEEGRLRGLDTYLSYRIGLRTFSAMESRVVLGDTAAFELPRSPGHGYLRYGTEPLVRFRAAYVSGRFRRALTGAGGPAAIAQRIEEYTTAYVAPQAAPATPVAQTHEEPADGEGESLLDVLVGRIAGRGTPAHRVWLPPLKESFALDALVPLLEVRPDRGLTVSAPELHGALRASVGVVDRPFEQRRETLWLDMSGSGGHAVLVGGPQSGKSTFLRTLVVGLALTHTPREVQVYCLDFGGGSLAGLRELPHVGGVATRLDPGQVRRTVAELRVLLAERERRFGAQGIDSIGTYRRRKRAGEFADDPFGDVFLVVDGWSTIRSDFEDLETQLTELVTRGLSYGVHVVATAGQWMELRPAVRDAFGTRLELRLGDPTSSTLDRRAAMNVPEKAPGRGITPEKLQFLTALPRVDGKNSTDDLPEGLAALVADARQAWEGPGAPPVRLLPDQLPYASLPLTEARPGVPIGVAEADLQPVWLDFSSDPHALVFGDSECGKSSFLRALAKAIVDRNSLTQARIIIVDYRRSLLGAITTEHQIGYGTSAPVTQGIVTEVSNVMRQRLPGPDVTAEQLRARSWWKGPDLYVLVDDYDLVAGGGGTNPLSPLLEFVGQARDIGLHLVITRRSGGASRALYEPLLMRLRELGSPGIVMSGDKNEGVLLGTVKPGPQPPGRGWFVTRREGARLIQLAWLPPSD